MEHKIGEVITLPDGRKAEVVEEINGCDSCVFDDFVFGCESSYMCGRNNRTDHKGIIYKEIK